MHIAHHTHLHTLTQQNDCFQDFANKLLQLCASGILHFSRVFEVSIKNSGFRRTRGFLTDVCLYHAKSCETAFLIFKEVLSHLVLELKISVLVAMNLIFFSEKLVSHANQCRDIFFFC